jgi:hypothetical protein
VTGRADPFRGESHLWLAERTRSHPTRAALRERGRESGKRPSAQALGRTSPFDAGPFRLTPKPGGGGTHTFQMNPKVVKATKSAWSPMLAPHPPSPPPSRPPKNIPVFIALPPPMGENIEPRVA